MDRLLVLTLGLFIFSSCARVEKSENTVFPEVSTSCRSTAHKTRYIVKKTDGSIEIKFSSSREVFLKDFVRPHLKELDFVEPDQILSLEEVPREEISPTANPVWGPERMGAQVAWQNGLLGNGVLVAVIDSGVDISHPSFSQNIFTNLSEANGVPSVDDDKNGFIDDIHGWDFSRNTPENFDDIGHGTHVAGIIAGKTNTQSFGVAPNAIILPLDFMTEHGTDTQGNPIVTGYTSDAISALEYAKKMNVKIINASWSSTFCSKLLSETINSLKEKEILFVAAAGNSGKDLSHYPEYPAAFQLTNQITVGALTPNGFMAQFSNYGRLVDLLAPGTNVLSALPNGSYGYMDGTSMAAPMVSGAAAILAQVRPEISALDLKTLLLESVRTSNYPVLSKGEVYLPLALGKLGIY